MRVVGATDSFKIIATNEAGNKFSLFLRDTAHTDGYDLLTSIFAPELGQTVVKIDSFEGFLKFFRQKYSTFIDA